MLAPVLNEQISLRSVYEVISVCMATFNGENYLREQLDSILMAISDSDELIVSDDGSVDSTRDILSEYEERSPNIRIFDGPREGVVANFENAILHSSGDVIFLSDQDDFWYADKVERVLEARQCSGANVIVHDACLVNENGAPMGATMFGLRNSRAGLIKNLVKNSFVGCCMAIDKEVFEAALPIPRNVEMHDWWIGLVSELWFQTTFIDDVLIDYRRHGQNVSSLSHYRLPRMVKNRCDLINELIKRSFRKGDL